MNTNLIPKTAIEKAVEGGWILNSIARDRIEEWPEIAVCDHTFWQALGKALGWGILKVKIGSEWHETPTGRKGHTNAWHSYAIDFYDLILTGGDTEAFWKELLK